MAFYSVDPVLFGVGVSGTTATLGVNDPELGTRMVVDELEYLFVYNAGGEQIGVGQPCVLSGVTGYSVTVSSVTGTDMAIGCRQNSTMPTATYGWIATRGIGTVEMGSNNSCVTGELLEVGTEGFALRGNVETNVTAFPTPAAGKALESLASGASGIAYFTFL
ncbi:MAG: hypothetical protein JSV32_00340 [Dehalococcoidia bacterium]|nr:MAG: hypothetical protein JSV32_00340 [Dehalococcoidia bacterium]